MSNPERFADFSETGIFVIPSGNSWENAFAHAKKFISDAHAAGGNLETSQRLLLGDGISRQAALGLWSDFLGNTPVAFGRTMMPWQDWITEHTRARMISQGKLFREFPLPAKREFLRNLLELLQSREMLPVLREIWREEKLFHELLETIDEFRLAGFCDSPSLEILREVWSGAEGSELQPVKQELCTILEMWSSALEFSEAGDHDFPRILRAAIAEPIGEGGNLFLLGFSRFHLLEQELIREISRTRAVFLALPLSRSEVERAIQGKDAPEELQNRSAWKALSLLAAHSDAKIASLDLDPEDDGAEEKFALPLAEAATPLEEARCAGFFLRMGFAKKRLEMAQVLVPRGYFSDPHLVGAFQSGLGEDSIASIFPLRSSNTRIFLQLCQTLEILAEGYPLANCLEFAALCADIQDKPAWKKIPEIALRAGIGNGLQGWKELTESKQSEAITEFYSLLESLPSRFPMQATARVYDQRLREFIAHISYGELPRLATENSAESAAHAAISMALKAAAMLGTHTEAKFSLADWISEWRLMVHNFGNEEGNLSLPQLQVFEVGDWLPPLGARGMRLFLGVNSQVNPKAKQGFLLREADRLSLANWCVSGSLSAEADHLDWFRRATQGSGKLLSTSLTDDFGKEISPALYTKLHPVFRFPWPAANAVFPKRCQPAKGGEQEFQVDAQKLESVSPTLLDDWQACGFRALVNRVWKLKEGLQAGELDVSALADGNLIHRALEIFYGQEKGHRMRDPLERKTALAGSFALAEAELNPKLEYFRGGSYIRGVSRAQTLRRLEAFTEAENQNFEAFPNLTELDCEVKLDFTLPSGRRLSGKADRVDRDAGKKIFQVHDYKTGSQIPTTKDVAELKKLQLPLYVHGLSRQGFGEPIGAFYVKTQPYERQGGLLRKRFNRSAKNTADAFFKVGPASKALLEEEAFYALVDAACAEAEKRAGQIEAGSFPIRPDDEEDCKRCNARPICRIRDDYQHIDAAAASGAEDFLAVMDLAQELRVPEAHQSRAVTFSHEQELALSARNQLVFLEASAGSGKTTILVERYVRAIREIMANKKCGPGSAAERILAASFTEKSAEEIRERLMQRLASEFGTSAAIQASRGITTIHGLCRKIVGEFANLVGVDPYAEVLDENASNELVGEIVFDFFSNPPEVLREDFDFLFLVYKRKDIEDILTDILAKRSLFEFDREKLLVSLSGTENGFKTASAELGRKSMACLIRVFDQFTVIYDKKKASRAVLDFNDLERLAWKALQNPNAQENYRKNFDLLLVDEFQDTNSLQRHIIDLIAKDRLSNVFVVGDAKQSIYRFRAADVSVFQRLRQEAGARGVVCELSANYRSQAHIVGFANKISERIFPAEIPIGQEYEAGLAIAAATKPPGNPVRLLAYSMEGDHKSNRKSRRALESEKLVALLARLHADGKNYSDIAILFRAISGNEIFLDALQLAGIPYRIANRGRFWSNQAILDGISFLRSLVDDSNRIALAAVLRSPWFDLSARELDALARAQRIQEFYARDPRAAWWRELRAQLNFSRLSDLLLRAYGLYPEFRNRFERLQMEKLVRIIDELESVNSSKFNALESLCAQSGWESEISAVRTSAVPEGHAEGAVQILTVHGAKGLQFDTVVLCDVDGAVKPEYPILRYLPGDGLALKFREENGEWNRGEEYEDLGNRNSLREIAELKRLLYVAVTRPQNELFILLERDEAESDKPRKTKNTWGDWIRSADIRGHAEFFALDEPGITEASAPVVSPQALHEKADLANFSQALLTPERIMSISEIAAYVFCPEFHRLKYVLQWEDEVVDFWQGNGIARKPNLTRASPFLRELRLSNKDRGIAIHRVLERLDRNSHSTEEWRAWLGDSYRNSGADSNSPALAALLDCDLEVLNNFLRSEVGEKLFSSGNRSFPELRFQLRQGDCVLSGTVDRVVELESDHWLVADYKTASISGNLQRYTFQVQSYMLAVGKYLRNASKKNIRVDGWLIDLFSGEAISVSMPDYQRWGRKEIEKISQAHASRNRRETPEARGIIGSEACTACAYISHCSIGQHYMVNYSQ